MAGTERIPRESYRSYGNGIQVVGIPARRGKRTTRDSRRDGKSRRNEDASYCTVILPPMRLRRTKKRIRQQFLSNPVSMTTKSSISFDARNHHRYVFVKYGLTSVPTVTGWDGKHCFGPVGMGMNICRDEWG